MGLEMGQFRQITTNGRRSERRVYNKILFIVAGYKQIHSSKSGMKAMPFIVQVFLFVHTYISD